MDMYAYIYIYICIYKIPFVSEPHAPPQTQGLATFVAALADPALGASVAVAIAIHNVPEGVRPYLCLTLQGYLAHKKQTPL